MGTVANLLAQVFSILKMIQDYYLKTKKNISKTTREVEASPIDHQLLIARSNAILNQKINQPSVHCIKKKQFKKHVCVSHNPSIKVRFFPATGREASCGDGGGTPVDVVSAVVRNNVKREWRASRYLQKVLRLNALSLQHLHATASLMSC